MIPYYQPPSIPLGPFTLEPFGLFAAAGIYLGARLALGRAMRMGLDPRPVAEFALWGVIAGVIGGHAVHIFLYHPEELSDPVKVFSVWDGLSSLGGLAGAVIAAVIWFRRKGIPLADYHDPFALGMAPGWSVARLGCFAVHDHPGVRTDFLLAVQFPGGPRHDLGLYDAMVLAAIAVLLWTLATRRLMAGRLLAVLGLCYGVARFLLDFLRATDVAYADARYLGLTPAQYLCFAIVGWSVWRLREGAPTPPSEAPPQPPAGPMEG